MKIPILTVLLIFCGKLLYSQLIPDTNNYYRQQLQQLLTERQQKFTSYSKSLAQRSGIFGNKTKNDIRQSNEVLIDLVKTDNHIIDVLNRVVDFRNYERVSLGYDVVEYKNHLSNLLHATDTLSKQVTVLTGSNIALKAQKKKLTWAFYCLSLMLVIFLIIRIRQKNIL